MPPRMPLYVQTLDPSHPFTSLVLFKACVLVCKAEMVGRTVMEKADSLTLPAPHRGQT